MAEIDRQRVVAFKSAMLNTVVRGVRSAFEGLTLSNCLESEDFRSAAWFALSNSPLFSRAIEPAMHEARLELIYEIEKH